MAGTHLGHLRGLARPFGRDYLFAAEIVLCHLQILHWHYYARLYPLRRLASDRGFKDIWIPFCERRLYDDLYAIFLYFRRCLCDASCPLDNGTGAPVGWNWILSL